MLCWTPFQLQLTEGSLQVTDTDTQLTWSACRFTAKLQSTVKGRSMFVIIHKIICLSIIGITLYDLEMQAWGSQGKHKEAMWGFSSLPKTSACQGLRLKDEDRLHQGHCHHPIPLPTSPKEPQRKKIYPPQKHCSISYHLQVQTPHANSVPWQKQLHMLSERDDAIPSERSYVRSWQAEDVFVGIPNAIWGTKQCGGENANSWQHATCKHLTPKWKPFRVNTLLRCLWALRDIYRLNPQLGPNHTMEKKESSNL